MGNICVGPTYRARFFESVTAAVWRPRINADDLPSSPSNPNTNPNPSLPPEPVKIPGHSPPQAPQRQPLPEQQPPPTKNPAPHVKRSLSAGLMAESVLNRKTEKLKDIYSIGRKLGQGQFGTTYLCIEKSTGRELACKSIAKRKLISAEDVEDVRREIQIMHHLAGHPNVIKIIGAYEDAVAVHLVMELCAGGELFDRILQRGHYSEKAAASLARVIVGVVEACHSLGVMHRDLKPENFLFVSQSEESKLKTIDFGLSIFFKPGDWIAFELELHDFIECDTAVCGAI